MGVMSCYHALLIALVILSSVNSFVAPPPAVSPWSSKRTAVMAFRQEFGTGGRVLLAVSVACLLKARLSTIDVRSTTVCPSGPGMERVIEKFKSNDKDFHCLPFDEWTRQIILSPVVLPGSAEWDPTLFQGPRGLPNSVPLERH